MRTKLASRQAHTIWEEGIRAYATATPGRPNSYRLGGTITCDIFFACCSPEWYVVEMDRYPYRNTWNMVDIAEVPGESWDISSKMSILTKCRDSGVTTRIDHIIQMPQQYAMPSVNSLVRGLIGTRKVLIGHQESHCIIWLGNLWKMLCILLFISWNYIEYLARY
jgi:hypothetical protein